jgi:hypothetical protein
VHDRFHRSACSLIRRRRQGAVLGVKDLVQRVEGVRELVCRGGIDPDVGLLGETPGPDRELAQPPVSMPPMKGPQAYFGL